MIVFAVQPVHPPLLDQPYIKRGGPMRGCEGVSILHDTVALLLKFIFECRNVEGSKTTN